MRPLRLTEVHRAPDVPGIYVWYAALVLGQADIKNTKSLILLLNQHSILFERQRMEVRAKLNFDLRWKGEIDGTQFDDSFSPDIDLPLRSRDLIVRLLTASQHLFFQPLYIGKAEKSLRQRLQQHKDEFLRLKDAEGQQNSAQLRSQGEDNFAQRAVKLGFQEDQLICYALDVGVDLDMEEEETGRAVSLVESYLNNWAAPLLGRR